jgi:hypothetical protein
MVIAALLAMLWQMLRAPRDSVGATISKRGLGGNVLGKWSGMAIAPERIHLLLDSAPTPVDRAWLAALAGAGSRVTWSGDVEPLMIDASPVAAPAGGTKVLVTAPRASLVVLSDEIGTIDTIRTLGVGASIALKGAKPRLIARAIGVAASTTVADSVALHKVAVIGSAGWESKFVIAALEEEGWKVDAFIRVAPGVDVTQGSAAAIDTSRYSAVVALDSAAAPYATRIAEFVRQGGGLVMEPGAALLDGMSALRAGNVGNVRSSSGDRQGNESMNEGTLPLRPILSLRGDAIPLQNRNGSVTLAARRVRAGRVLHTGYDETWRWRMDGGDDGVRDHRLWWTDLLSKVAYAAEAPRPSSVATTALDTDDEAPLADLIASIGPASPDVSAHLSGTTWSWMIALFLLLALALLTEVTSRRSRGVT